MSGSFDAPFGTNFADDTPVLLHGRRDVPFFAFLDDTPTAPSWDFEVVLPTGTSRAVASTTPWKVSHTSALPVGLVSKRSFGDKGISFADTFPFSSSTPVFAVPAIKFFFPVALSVWVSPVFTGYAE